MKPGTAEGHKFYYGYKDDQWLELPEHITTVSDLPGGWRIYAYGENGRSTYRVDASVSPPAVIGEGGQAEKLLADKPVKCGTMMETQTAGTAGAIGVVTASGSWKGTTAPYFERYYVTREHFAEQTFAYLECLAEQAFAYAKLFGGQAFVETTASVPFQAAILVKKDGKTTWRQCVRFELTGDGASERRCLREAGSADGSFWTPWSAASRKEDV